MERLPLVINLHDRDIWNSGSGIKDMNSRAIHNPAIA